MLVSMTGFSTATIQLPIGTTVVSLTASLKSLNSRFFEASCKLPLSLQNIETTCIKRIKTSLMRGNISFTVHISSPNMLKTNVAPSLGIVDGYIKAIKEIQEKYQLSGNLTVHEIITLPYIFDISEVALDQSVSQPLLEILDDLIKQLLAERMREGQALEADIVARIKIIDSHMEAVEPRAKQVLEDKKQNLINVTQSLQIPNYSEQIEHHLALVQAQLDKSDLNEEIVRFKTHSAHLKTIIADEREIEKGKKIDFTLQELLREVNTIAAKCNDSLISSSVVSIKVELEKIREQVQNIV